MLSLWNDNGKNRGGFLETLYSGADSDLQACKFYFQTLQSHDPKPIDTDIFMDLPYFFSDSNVPAVYEIRLSDHRFNIYSR